jgi:scyllo-inositol 2-dehydrogenase (NADP+)
MKSKVVIIGLGTQGKKRKTLLEKDHNVVTVDPQNSDADSVSLTDEILNGSEFFFLCVPDSCKFEYIKSLLTRNKSVLVEKPFQLNDMEADWIAEACNSGNGEIYVAYNHRFEPNICLLRKALNEASFEKIFKFKLFYGNGTSLDVKNSVWRDQGFGVLDDLGSHAFDIANFLFSPKTFSVDYVKGSNFETKSFDNIEIGGSFDTIEATIELSLQSWRNSFFLDVTTDTGSFHLKSLCKWGPASFTERRRKFPSGKPEEQTSRFVQADPTWEQEHAWFLQHKFKTADVISQNHWVNSQLNKVQERFGMVQT